MKLTTNIRSFAMSFSLAIVTMLLPTLGHAQSNNQYFDSNGTTWDAGITQDWDGGTHTWTAGNFANFSSNTVTVSGTVSTEQIDFNSGSSTISGGIIDLTWDTGNGDYANIDGYNGSGPNTISSELDLGLSGPDNQINVNPGSGNLTLGNIVWAGSGAGERLQLNSFSGGGSITLNGTYTSGSAATINFGANSGSGTYNITSTANFTGFGGQFSMTGNALNIATSNFNGQTIGFHSATSANQINIQGAQNLNLYFYSDQKNDGSLGRDAAGNGIYGGMVVNQSTADESSWNGGTNTNGGNITAEAVSGGRLNFTSNIGGSMPLGLTVNADTTSTGVVVISGNNSYDLRDGNGGVYNGTGLVYGGVAATIAHGTALITNTVGSAFGTNSGVVNVNAGATLGGSGISTEAVVVAGGGIIAPGDPGQTNPSSSFSVSASTATLNLTGGLSMASGAIMSFKISADGASNDAINLGAGALTLAGTTEVNFTALGTVNVWTPGNANFYSLLSGTGTWTTSPTFDINAPRGSCR